MDCKGGACSTPGLIVFDITLAGDLVEFGICSECTYAVMQPLVGSKAKPSGKVMECPRCHAKAPEPREEEPIADRIARWTGY
jgi:hypothetical protein